MSQTQKERDGNPETHGYQANKLFIVIFSDVDTIEKDFALCCGFCGGYASMFKETTGISCLIESVLRLWILRMWIFVLFFEMMGLMAAMHNPL